MKEGPSKIGNTSGVLFPGPTLVGKRFIIMHKVEPHIHWNEGKH